MGSGYKINPNVVPVPRAANFTLDAPLNFTIEDLVTPGDVIADDGNCDPALFLIGRTLNALGASVQLDGDDEPGVDLIVRGFPLLKQAGIRSRDKVASLVVGPASLGLLTNLHAYWPMDDDSGTVAVDVHSTHDLSINAEWAKDTVVFKKGSSLRSDDVAQWGQYSGGPNAQAVTLAGWFDPGGGNNTGQLCVITDQGNTQLRIEMDGGTNLILRGHGDTVSAGVGPTAFGHYALVWDGVDTLSAYVDGAFRASITPTQTLADAMTFRVASVEGGWHDEWGVWLEALSPTKIAALYNAGAGRSYAELS